MHANNNVVMTEGYRVHGDYAHDVVMTYCKLETDGFKRFCLLLITVVKTVIINALDGSQLQ